MKPGGPIMTHEEKLTLAKKFIEANGRNEITRIATGEKTGEYCITPAEMVHFANSVNHVPDAGNKVTDSGNLYEAWQEAIIKANKMDIAMFSFVFEGRHYISTFTKGCWHPPVVLYHLTDPGKNIADDQLRAIYDQAGWPGGAPGFEVFRMCAKRVLNHLTSQ